MKFGVPFVQIERKDNSLLEAVDLNDDNVFFAQPYLHAVVALGQGLHADRVKSRFNSSSRSSLTFIDDGQRLGRSRSVLAVWLGECSACSSFDTVFLPCRWLGTTALK